MNMDNINSSPGSLLDIIRREEANAGGQMARIAGAYAEGARIRFSSIGQLVTSPRRLQRAIMADYDVQRVDNIVFSRAGNAPGLVAADYGPTTTLDSTPGRPGGTGSEWPTSVYGMVIDIVSSSQEVIPSFTVTVAGNGYNGDPITNSITVDAANAFDAGRRTRLTILPGVQISGGFTYTPFKLNPQYVATLLPRRVVTVSFDTTFSASVRVVHTLLTRGQPEVDALVRDGLNRSIRAEIPG